MSIDSTLRKAAKLAKSGDRAGAAALYREVLAKFPGNATAKKGLAALAGPRGAAAPGPRPGGMPGGALGAGLIPGARPVAPPPGLKGGPARPAPQPNRTAAPAAPKGKSAPRPATGGPAPGAQQMQQLEQLMAKRAYRAVVTEGQRLAMLFPRAPGLLNMIALAQARLGQNAEALANYDRVLEIDPGFAGAHVNKANIYAFTGENEKAEVEARAALKLDPNSAQGNMVLGYALVNQRRPDEAISMFEAAVKLAPRTAQYHLGLGNAYASIPEPEKALDAFRAAYEIDPESPEVLNNLANALVVLKRFEEGVEIFEAAAKHDTRNAVLFTNYARALRELGRGPEAAEICKRALAIDDGRADSWSVLGAVMRELGDREGAANAIDRARAIDPNNLHALALRWHVDTLPLDHEERPYVEQLASDENVSDDVRAGLSMVMFRAYDKVGDAEAAMPWLLQSKALRSKNDPYDIAAHGENFEALKDAFRAGVEPLSEADMAAIPAPARPVFIVGMPRSGTSLVEQILASHSQVYGAGELASLGTAMGQFGWIPGGECRPFDRETLIELRRSYFDYLAQIQVTKPVVTDKTPLNFRHVGPALAAMPEARVLFMRRDSRATCWSNFSNSFQGRANNFGNDMRDLAQMYRYHLDFLDFWQALYPDRVTVVPYERLTENQEEESRKLVAAAGLDWEPACLDFHKTKRSVRTVSSSQVRKKMYTGSSEAWRRYEPWIGPLLDALKGIDDDRQP